MSLCRAIALAVFTLLCWVPAVAVSLDSRVRAPPAGATRRALLIAINKYQSDDIPPLRGPKNDIAVAEQILTTRYGFPPDQIRKLVGESATREAIVSALRALAKTSGPKDVIYIHYSGHGSQTDDRNSDEADGLDETIVPYDGRLGEVEDITDDELGEILGSFSTPHLVVVLDSCHSGTATRNLEIKTRSIPKDTRRDLYKRSSVISRAVVTLERGRHLLLGAAHETQSALDGPIDRVPRGLFSYALFKTLGVYDSLATVESLATAIDAELERTKVGVGLVSIPEPQIEGAKEKLSQPLFPALARPDDSSRFSWVEVETAAPGQVTLKNAQVMGATPGSTWLIYPAGEVRFEIGHSIATARVSGLRGADASATVEPPGAVIPQGARAIALTQGASDSIVIAELSTLADSDRPFAEALQKVLTGIRFVGPTEFSHFLIQIGNHRCQLFGAGGIQMIEDFPVTEDMVEPARRLMRIFERSSAAAELSSVVNLSPTLKLEARFLTGMKSPATLNSAGTNDVMRQYRIRRNEDPNSPENTLQIEVRVSEEAFLTIVDVDQEGAVNVLFPLDYQRPDFCPDGQIPPATWVAIPDSFQDGNRAGFVWDITPPSGVDTIRVFATRTLEGARLIRQYVQGLATESKTRGGPGSRVSFAPLRENLGRMASRGVGARPSRPEPAPSPSPSSNNSRDSDWNAVSLTIVVEDPTPKERP